MQATSNGNTAVMKQRIEAARGDVIELKITNENTQLIPETGVRLETSRQGKKRWKQTRRKVSFLQI